jgi:hypothetical protein
MLIYMSFISRALLVHLSRRALRVPVPFSANFDDRANFGSPFLFRLLPKVSHV